MYLIMEFVSIEVPLVYKAHLLFYRSLINIPLFMSLIPLVNVGSGEYMNMFTWGCFELFTNPESVESKPSNEVKIMDIKRKKMKI